METKPENKFQNKSIQTFAEDMAKVIQDDRGGLIKKIIHEEEEHEREKRNLSPEAKKNKFFMYAGMTLVFSAVGMLAFFLSVKNSPLVPVETQLAPIIFSDKSAYFEVKGFKKSEIIQTILREVTETEVKKGGVQAIYLTQDKIVIGFKEFMTLMESSLVVDANVVSNNFLLGLVNGEAKTALDLPPKGELFFLLKVRSITDIFGSMKEWENKMFFDLHELFGVPLSPETNYLLTADFVDGIMQNKNARILYSKNEGEENKIIMMYVFADDNSVIIANTENAVREVMLRLASSQIKK